MFLRPIALFLALVLFWSGFTTQEQAGWFASASGTQMDAQWLGNAPGPELAGSVEDHHLDDQPTQAQADGGTDLLALVLRAAEAPTRPLASIWPGPHVMVTWIAPTLDGLRRPPRGISFIS